MENVWVNLIVSICSALVVVIPLVAKLVTVIRDSVKSSQWSPVMKMVVNLMAEAEENYSTGAERKEYVMDTIKAMADSMDYAIDMDVISSLIDSICAMSKTVNKK